MPSLDQRLASLDKEEALLKQRKAALLRRKLSLVKENGLYFYHPWLKQDLFHRAGAKRFRLFRAGNRTGKSTAACAEDCAWLMGHRPWYPDDDPARTVGIPQRPVKLLLITTDWDKVDEIWTGQRGMGGKLWTMLPKGFVKTAKRNHAGVIDTVECANGALFRADTVQSFIKNPQGSESSDWDAVNVDEPCPEDMWKAVHRGLVDRGGSAWFTLTPLKERWINDMFYPSPGSPNNIPASRWAVTASIFENPFISEEGRHDYLETLTPEEHECRALGIPLELSGLVYKEFDYTKHVLTSVPFGWKDYWTPPDNYVVSFSVDPHPQTPHAVLFLAVAPSGQVFIYDEIFRQTTPELLAEEILRRVGGRRVHLRKCDPLAWINDPITSSCLAEELTKCGVWVDKASKAKEFGILQTRRALTRPGYIYVNPELKRFLFEINRYCYDKENKPIDKDDHMMEAMYRLFINDLIWFDATDNMAPVEDEDILFNLAME
jgi:hypothetical protein